MRRFRGIIEDYFPPKDTNLLWLYNRNIHYFNEGRWVNLSLVSSNNNESLGQTDISKKICLKLTVIEGKVNDVSKLIPIVEQLIAILEDRINNINIGGGGSGGEADLSDIYNSLDSLGSSIQIMQQALTSANLDIEDNAANIETLAGKIPNIESGVESNAANIQSNSDSLKELNNSLTNISSDLNLATSDITLLNNKYTSLNSIVTSLNNTVTILQNLVTSLNSTVINLRDRVAPTNSIAPYSSTRISTLSNIPNTYKWVLALISESLNFVLSSTGMINGDPIHVIIRNVSSSTITVTLPLVTNTPYYKSDSIDIEPNSWVEVRAIKLSGSLFMSVIV